MTHVEITLKSGATITADVSEWTTTCSKIDNSVTGYEWAHCGPRRIAHLRAEEVAAVIFVDDEVTA